ncbi:MAG TPA: hypothetical protein EYG02_03910 [Henriciella marina]|uniref:hypothetical protein n=1 Tax=Henriciella sp. TaxID=1968823 RepID=UPI0017DF1B11|nr:hypothetical protein [Henriciella sp.]HIG23318.1 hypothetical protein [Henriciella sp.]HIK64159.1 hypothetical protein [Henriciella marina]
MKQVSVAVAALVAGLGIQPIAGAQEAGEAAPQAAPPSCEGDVYDDFDFWLGEWDVTTPDGRVAGTNSITKAEDGCLLIERWTGARGSTGQSYNFYDTGLQKWRQVWVARGATIDYAGKLTEDGEMRLEGKIAYRNGTTAPFRGSWTPEADGSVTQYFQQYNSETESWDDWFTGIYRRSAASQ